jgi:hypothetical protein
MATGRTVQRFSRIYINGYDLSGYARTCGPQEVTVDEANMTTWTDPVKSYLKDRSHVNIGTLNAVFDNTATAGLHAVLGTAGDARNIILAKGIRAAPAAGDPAFLGTFEQSAYQIADDGAAVTANIPFQGWPGDAVTLAYGGGWGVLLHASGAETGANSAAGIDCLAGSALGGFMVYQILASNAAGNVTVKVQHSTTTNVDGSFSDLGGCTSGAIANTSIPASGIVATTNPATAVGQYLRWQIALAGGMTTVTFVLAFYRA